MYKFKKWDTVCIKHDGSEFNCEIWTILARATVQYKWQPDKTYIYIVYFPENDISEVEIIAEEFLYEINK